MSFSSVFKGESLRTLRKVLRVIGRYRFLLLGSMLLAGLTVALQLYVPVLFGVDQPHVPPAVPGSNREARFPQ